MRRRGVAAALAVVVVAGACSVAGHLGPAEAPVNGPAATVGGPRGSRGSGSSTLTWTPCGAGLECATFEVPLDYAKPTDRQVPIALERHRATGPRPVGPLLLNPGGPGESGLTAMQLYLDTLSPALQARFDLVVFDPRGVGRSEGVQCADGPALDTYLDLDPAPSTAAGRQALVDATRQFVSGCVANSRDILPFVGSVNAARDMDLIRAALGQSHLNFFGASYGTSLGAIFADLFPTHVGVMVLDGAIDPALGPIATSDAQSAGLDASLNRFFADCAASAGCAWKPAGDLHHAFDRLMAGIRAHPLTVGPRVLGPGEALLGVAAPLYDRQSWPRLAQALQQLSNGDGTALLDLFDIYAERHADGSYAHTLEASSAINCADQSWPTDPGAYPGLAAEAAKRAPEFGPANIYSGLTCALWPTRGTLAPRAVHAAGSPPILVVGSTQDPITPYAWATALAGELQHGVLLTRVGDGHTGYGASSCIRDRVDAYLINGVPPAAGTRCSP